MKMQSRKKATRDALIAKAQKFLDEVTEEESKMLDQIRLLAKPVGLLYFFCIFSHIVLHIVQFSRSSMSFCL